jgi:hypothetical protein
MAALPDLLVDPYLVCLPRYCDHEEQLDEFVQNLMSWSEILQRHDVAIHFPRACLETLLSEGSYPFEYEFRRLAASVAARHLSPDLVCKIAQEVLERTPSLEENCEIAFLDFEERDCKIDPPVYVTRLTGNIAWGFKHALAVVTSFQEANDDAKLFLLVSSKSDPQEAFASQEVQITVHISGVECSDALAKLKTRMPLDIDRTLPVAFYGKSLLQSVGCLKLWAQAASPSDVRDAINARLEEVLSAGTGKKEDIRGFIVGEHFLQSARHNGFRERLNIVDSCARIIVNEPKNSIEPFRVSADDSSEQRTRGDGALAFRTHLTKDGPGYRLMFWELTDKSIEFANVGPKKELVIR